jgi:Lrp/AsnC family transcriptional regulator, leucine-responsive regulatory protein
MPTPAKLIDEFDRKILDIVQRDCQLKAEAVAAQVGLSASAVLRRLRRLREQGVIRAEVAVLDRQSVGNSLTLLVGLEIERDNYPALAGFRAWAEKVDAIQQVYYVTGQMDLMLIVTARSMADYDALCARLMADNPVIRRMNTHVVIDAMKLGLQVPVEMNGSGA